MIGGSGGPGFVRNYHVPGHGVDGSFALADTFEIQVLKLANEEQIGDLLDGGEGIGDAGAPKERPKVVNFLAELW